MRPFPRSVHQAKYRRTSAFSRLPSRCFGQAAASRILEKRRALSRWGARLEAIIEGAPRMELRLEGRR